MFVTNSNNFLIFVFMKLFISNNKFFDTQSAIDISIPVKSSNQSVRAWYLDKPEISPVRTNEFLGSIEEGGSVNFRNIFFNPHGHGTHTECCGHITPEVYSVNQVIKHFFVHCLLVTVEPIKVWNEQYKTFDFVITKEQISDRISNSQHYEALVVRTAPNEENKRSLNYSNSNPPFFEVEVVDLLNELGVIHFLTDLPSVDRELDGGELAFHHRYWNVPFNPDLQRTITELVYVNNEIKDGEYILELQVAPIENDASPSRPVLYEIKMVASGNHF